MTTISQKQSSLAVAALAFIAGVALSVPSVSAANLATYDFEFKFADTTSASGFITVDKDDKTSFSSNSSYDSSAWSQPKWVDFSYAYLGKTLIKADAATSSYFYAYDFPNSSPFHHIFGSFYGIMSLNSRPLFYGQTPATGLYGQASSTGYLGYGSFDYDSSLVTSFTLTPRAVPVPVPVPGFALGIVAVPVAVPVPVPGFAFGIVAAGGWLASKQLRRKTQTAKQSVSA